MEDALERAKAVAGGNTGLALALTARGNAITAQAVSQWKRVPAQRALEVELVTGVARHELRPDIYPAPGAETLPAPALEATGTAA